MAHGKMTQGKIVDLSGVVERVTFHNTETGYCVLKVRAKGQPDSVPVVGYLSQIIAGQAIKAIGEWIIDPSFGYQFKAKSIDVSDPIEPSDIIKFLSSGMIKGIGPVYAKRIVAHFGSKTIETLDKSISFLDEVPGISKKKLPQIRQSWAESRQIRHLFILLKRTQTKFPEINLGEKTAIQIYKKYGDTAMTVIQENPYTLIGDLRGISFKKADAIALSVSHIDSQSPLRAKACVRFVLQEAAMDGHVCLPEDAVIEQTVSLTEINREVIESATKMMIEALEVIREQSETEARTNYLYLKSLHNAEVGVAEKLHSLLKGKHPLKSMADMEAAVNWAEKKMAIQFASLQRKAIKSACEEKVLLITGGPGTGKTTLIKAILDIFEVKGLRVLLAAPTGRAAKRLAESTGRQAKTIHRLLEFNGESGSFRFGGDEPLDVDLIIIDETSMVDIKLACDLLKAIPPFACVIFVGDMDQLPSVGPGSVLADMISSDVLPVVRLKEVHRQAAESWIVRAAHSINSGQEPESAPPVSGEGKTTDGKKGDFFIVESEEPSQLVERILQMVKERIPQRFGFDPFKDIQVLCPMNKTELGVQNLNEKMQIALNSKPENETISDGIRFKVGDKVIQTSNNYKREVFNGDIGRVVDVDNKDHILTVNFEGKQVIYDFKDLHELNLAYAITIHKSQGSEYPAVVIPVHTQNFVMLQRNLLYTAVTRGRKLVVLVGMRKAIWLAVNKADTSKRFSRLVQRLRACTVL